MVEPPVMVLVRDALKVAMRNKDVVSKNTLRDVISSVKNANIQKADSVSSDVSFHGLVSKLIDTRKKSAEEFENNDRKDLAEKELSEVQVLEKIRALVKVASEEDITTKVKQVLSTFGPDTSNLKMSQVLKKIDMKAVESEWGAPQKAVVGVVQKLLGVRHFSTYAGLRYSHDNPLGLSRRKSRPSQSQGKRPIKGVAKTILVSSAKGGVGKSTVAVNLALALFEKGHTVGILDVDIFGPSIPTMLKLHGEPLLTASQELIPLVNYGIKAMSMGFLITPGRAVAWRGLLVQKALQQLIFETHWGDLDYLVIDMPPGTGDVQLTLAQQIKVDGAVIVSTPQDIALIDATRGIDLFKSVNTPILGIVQNMSFFECPCCHTKTHLFGRDGALKEAEKRGIPVLASIPLSVDISAGGDAGKPVVLSESPAAREYANLADNVLKSLA